MMSADKIDRRSFLIGTGGIAAAAAFGATALNNRVFAAAPNTGRRPNIVFMFSDEHRYQSMSFTEMPEVITPNMKRIADEGASFRHCISNNPLCTPYRTMLMTGMWSYATLGLENNGRVPPDVNPPTLGKVFSAAGYATCYTGKWHIGLEQADTGFAWNYGWNNTDEHWKSETAALHKKKGMKPYKGYNARGMTDQAFEFLDANAKNDKPFFLMLAWNPPHAVFTDPPKEKRALYGENALPWRKNANEASKSRWTDNYYGYHSHISAIDDEVGRVLKKLDDLGIADNTIVIYTSDHGSMMNSHGKGNKRHAYEKSIRVPFLVNWPGKVKAGTTRNRLIGTIDMFPTLCGLAGIPVPKKCPGDDHTPNILGKNGPDRESQFIMHISNKKEFAKKKKDPNHKEHAPYFRGVRTKTHTYTVGVDGEWQLFDNVKDPFQQQNQIDNPAFKQVKETCRAQLDRWLNEAEYAYMSPPDRKRLLNLPLPERIKQQSAEALTIFKRKVKKEKRIE